MSRIEEMIKELCPEGVEWKELGEVAKIQRGASPRPIANFITEDINGVPWIKIGDTKIESKYVDKTKQRITEEGAKQSRVLKRGDFIISNSMSYGRPYILNIDGAIHDGWASISEFEQYMNSDFLYHLLSSNIVQNYWRTKINSSSVSNLNSEIIKSLTIPLPPLPIQEEIVRILDKFTELIAELKNELTLRKKQYAYYRDTLLTFGEEVEWKMLGEVAINLDNLRKPITSTNRESGDIPYYGASGIIDYVKDYIFDGDYLLVSEDGANLLARTTPIAFSISGKAWVNNHAHILEFETYTTRRYIEIYLNSIDLSFYITGTSQPKLNKANLNNIKIPLPSLAEQQRIVNILDRFDTLTSDLSQGLPAEIELRQKQYEYYRDKLLTFQPIHQAEV